MVAPSYSFENYSFTGTPVEDLITKIETRMADAGWTFIEQVVFTQNSVARLMRVWKCSGTTNAAGADFYVGLVRTNTTGAGYFVIRAFEGWNTTTKAMLRPVVINSQSQSASWYQVIYGDKFVTISNSMSTSAFLSSYAATSTNGIDWTARKLPFAASWSGLAYNGTNTYIAVAGYNGINASAPIVTTTNLGAYSTDGGVTWAQMTLPSSSAWSCCAYGAGVFVAVSSTSGAAASSPDGITWTARGASSAATFTAVAYGSGVGFAAVSTSATNAMFSTDGLTWTAATLPSSTSWNSVAFGNGTFVAVAGGGSAATSPTGAAWTARTLPVSSGLYGKVIFDGTRFVATSYAATAASQTVIYSLDGITWTTSPSSATISPLNCTGLAYGNGIYVVTATNVNSSAGLQAATVTDVVASGQSWTTRGLGIAYPAAPGEFPAANNLGSGTFTPGSNVPYQLAEYGPGTYAASTNYDIAILVSKSYLALGVHINGTTTSLNSVYVGLYQPAYSDSPVTNMPLCITGNNISNGVSKSVRVPLDSNTTPWAAGYAMVAAVAPESIMLGNHTGGLKEPVTNSIRASRAALTAGVGGSGFTGTGGLRGWLYDACLVPTTSPKVGDTITIGGVTWTEIGFGNGYLYSATNTTPTAGYFFNTAAGS